MFESHAVTRGSLRFAVLALALLVAAPAVAQKPQAGPQISLVKALPVDADPVMQEEHDAARKALLVTNAFGKETEPNDTPATANALGTLPVRIRADSFAVPVPGTGDVDVYSFTAAAGDRVYAATMSAFSAGSADPLIDIIASDQTTVIESDDEDGALGGSAANVAGVTLATAGTYYVRVRPFSTVLTGTIRPYDLYVRLLSGAPTAETEPNNNGTPQAMAASAWMSGAITPLADNDTYTVAANAGDTIVLIVDVDPERDSPEWNAVIGIGVFNAFFLTVNGGNVGGTFDDVNPSEAHFMTVDTTGSFQTILLENATSPTATGNPTNTYHMSVNVIPGDTLRTTTNTCVGTTGPITDAGTTNFTCTLAAGPIDNLQVRFNETHTGATPLTADLDVSLISPDGNEVMLFDDTASAAGAAAPQFNVLLDDEAAVPTGVFGVFSGMRSEPEAITRLEFFKGMEAGGVWTLRVRDDLATQTGTLNSWSLIAGARPTAGCTAPVTVFTAGFDTTDDLFTHSGTLDEWERGVPSFAPITTCHSGSCFDTDLDNTYDASATYDLISPPINLTSVAAPIALTWWQKYQIDTASNDPFWAEVRIVGNPASARKVWEWKGPLMTRSVGTPAATINLSAGWGVAEADISSFAGQIVEIRYHVQSSAATQLAGWAIDDVLVRSACLVPVELVEYSVE